MSIVIYAAAGAIAFVLAYTLQLSAAALAVGRALSESDSTTGLQDAVTPPWQASVALATYLAVLAVIAFAWWWEGWATALGVLGTVLVGTALFKRFSPQPASEHYRAAILRSMSRRYADFVRNGDTVRAEGMKMLLRRAGIDPEAIGGSGA